jgi:flagellar hook-basal body complex protein FliE
MPIEALKLVPSVGVKPVASSPSAGAAGATGFAEKLSSMMAGAEEKSAAANQAVTNMLDKTGDVHEAMIAMHHAEMSLQLTVQVRNKLVAAYNDIMRMPV